MSVNKDMTCEAFCQITHWPPRSSASDWRHALMRVGQLVCWRNEAAVTQGGSWVAACRPTLFQKCQFRLTEIDVLISARRTDHYAWQGWSANCRAEILWSVGLLTAPPSCSPPQLNILLGFNGGSFTFSIFLILTWRFLKAVLTWSLPPRPPVSLLGMWSAASAGAQSARCCPHLSGLCRARPADALNRALTDRKTLSQAQSYH